MSTPQIIQDKKYTARAATKKKSITSFHIYLLPPSFMTDQNVYEKIAQQIDEPILERRTCRRSGEKFPIFAGDKELLEKISPIINGKKYPLPLPTLSPRMREIRRLMRRNDTKLYKTTCVLTGQTLFSFYHPEMGYKIGDAYQWSAHVDNTNLGKAYDFSQPFGKQFAQLFQQTIKQHALIVGSMENSLYTHNIGGAKNCYMVFDAGMIEDIMYAVRVANTKKMIDGFEVRFTERAYECIGVSKCQNIFYAHNCSSCSDSALLYGCHGCHHCIGCTNLVNKSYHLFNKPVSKDEFDAARKKLFSGSRADVQKFKEQFTNLLTATPRSALQQTNTTNSI
ncbi:MAG: hypothetical protein Q8O99_01105 [bacterium]|nr:hypothetical protein [bacterium]